MTTEQPTLAQMTCPDCHRDFPAGMTKCPHDSSDLVYSADDPLIGRTFDRYEILERVGKGGMGVVYKARQTYTDQIRAIKVLYKEYAENQNALDRFQQEAKTLAALRHPNILQIVDFGVTPEKQPFLIMEFLQGTTLAELIERERRVPLGRALNIFAQTCDGLAHAHSKGVVHRDLKPGNLILIDDPDVGEQVKIVDFGIAKVKPPEGKESQRLTLTGEVYGSPLYMSPEQCLGRPMDERADIYSLGCVMYETLTGFPPLMGANSFETMTKHVEEKATSIADAVPSLGVPRAIDQSILHCMAKDPNHRTGSAVEVRRKLLSAAQQAGIDYSAYTSAANAEAKRASTDEAINATRMQLQQESSRQMRKLSVGFATAAVGIIGFAALLVAMPGPKEDPAPNWQKQVWRLEMTQGDRARQHYALDAKDPSLQDEDFREAERHYREARFIGKRMGPLYDNQLKAQLALLHLYEDHGNSSEAEMVREEMVTGHLNRMMAVYGTDAVGTANMAELDAALLSKGKFDPGKLDPVFASKYANDLIDHAKHSFEKKKFASALAYLQEAVALEERAKGTCRGSLIKCADEFSAKLTKTPLDSTEMKEMDDLLVRAKSAEQAN